MRLSRAIGFSLLLLPVLVALPFITAHSESATKIDPPAIDAPAGDGLETAVFAGGCFWGIQAVYQHTKGVTNAVSGYAGGTKESADYHSVSAGRTGHAEAVAVTFDPRVISYGKLLQIYFSVAHDPTQLNRQGPDYGTQYRSEIFPQNDAQRRVASGLYRAARRGEVLSEADRDQDRGRQGRVLSGGGLSPGLRDPAPDPAVYRDQRSAEGGESQDDAAGSLSRQARDGGAGEDGGTLSSIHAFGSTLSRSSPRRRGPDP